MKHRIFIVITAAILVMVPPLKASASSLKKPENPREPVVRLNTESRHISYPVTVDLTREKNVRGEIILQVSSLVFPGPGGSGRKVIKLSDIKTIEFQEWKGREYRRNGYIFTPSRIKIILNDGSYYITGGSSSLLNRIRFRKQGGKGVSPLFTRFYDYRKKKRWVNSGREEMNYPEKNPHPQVLVRIQFREKSGRQVLPGEILKLLKK